MILSDAQKMLLNTGKMNYNFLVLKYCRRQSLGMHFDKIPGSYQAYKV